MIGKTDCGLVWLTYGIENPKYRALVIRRNADDLSDWVDRALKFYHPLGAKIGYRPAVIVFPSGAIIRTGHLKDDQAYTKYQGHEYQKMLIEELTQIPEEKRYLQLLGSCRSTIKELKPQIFCTTNPGGIGHLWVKKRFVDVSIPNITYIDPTSGRSRIYIPARIDDNPTLLTADPGYVNFLESLKKTDEELWKAWRLGDWDVMAGQYFKMFRRNTHVVPPFQPKDNLVKFGGLDWGRAKPFCFLAGALEKVVYIDPELNEYKFNRVWIYRELYDIEKEPKEWAELIKKGVRLDQFNRISADPSIFHKKDDGSRSIADQFKENDVLLLPANNDRIGGWEVVKNWMSIAPDGLPYLLISEMCTNLIRTIPAQIHDENNPEDLDTNAEEHSEDALRYLLMHIVWVDALLGGIKRKQQQRLIPKHINLADPSKFR